MPSLMTPRPSKSYKKSVERLPKVQEAKTLLKFFFRRPIAQSQESVFQPFGGRPGNELRIDVACLEFIADGVALMARSAGEFIY